MTSQLIPDLPRASAPRGVWWAASFVGMGAVVYVISRAIVGSGTFVAHGDWLALAVALDLVVVVPALYYVLVVRGADARPLTTLPVFLLCVVIALITLPPGSVAADLLPLLALSAEALLVGLLVYNTRVLVRTYQCRDRQAEAFEDAFPRAARRALGSSRAIDVLCSEIVILYFALAAWRRKPVVPEHATAYTAHRDTGWIAIAWVLGLVVAIEVVVVHLLVSLWSPPLAWVLTGLGIYGLIWLVGDSRAIVLRPSLLTRETLHLRVGTRWSADLPLSMIREVRACSPAERPPALLALTAAGAPKHVIELEHPVEVRGMFGMVRRASRLGVAMDGARFASELTARLADAPRGADPPGDGWAPLTARAETAPEGRLEFGSAIRWLARPALERPSAWAAFNGLFLLVLVVSAAALSLQPVLRDSVLEAALGGGTAKLLLDELGRGSIGPATVAMLIFVNNLFVIAVFVVGASLLAPLLGVIFGLAFAVLFGAGYALAVPAAGLHLLAVVPVQLLEQQAVVLGMLFAWQAWRERGSRRPRSPAAPRRAWIRERITTAGPTLLGIGALLFVAALYEAALLFLVE